MSRVQSDPLGLLGGSNDDPLGLLTPPPTLDPNRKIKVVDGRGKVVEIEQSEFQQITPGTPAERRGFFGQLSEGFLQSVYDTLPPGLRDPLINLLPEVSDRGLGDPGRNLGGEGSHGIGGFVGQTIGGFAGLAGNADQIPANVLGIATGGALKGVSLVAKAAALESIALRKTGEAAVKAAAKAELKDLGTKAAAQAALLKSPGRAIAREALVNAIQGGALGGLQRASEVKFDGFVEDPIGAAGEVLGAAAVGAAGGAVAGAGFAGGSKLLKSPVDALRYRRTTNYLVKKKVLTREELNTIGKRPEVVVAVAAQRLAGNDVTISPDPSGKPRIKVVKSNVPWEVREGLEHNPELIDFYKESLRKGGRPLEIARPQGPATPVEVEQASAGLRQLATTLGKKLKPEDLTAAGAPATERALIYRDVDLLARQAERVTPETSRKFVTQAEGLLEQAKIVGDSTELIPAELSDAAVTRPEIVSKISLEPQGKLQLPLLEAKKAGYLKRASELAKSPAVAERVTTLQRKTIEQLQVLRSDARLSDVDKFKLARVLDTEYVRRVEEILKKDTNNPRSARALVVKELSAVADLPEPDLTLDSIEKALEVITTKYTNETQLGTVDRLLTELEDPAYKVPAVALRSIEGLRERMLRENDFRPWGERVREGRAELQRLLSEGLGIGKISQAKAHLLRLSQELPENLRKPLFDRALALKTREEIPQLTKDLATAQETYLRETNTNALLELFGRLDTATQRSQLEGLLKSLGRTKLAEPREVVGPVAFKVGEKIYKGLESDTHATLLTRLTEELPADEAKALSLAYNKGSEDISGFLSSKGRFLDRPTAHGVSQAPNTKFEPQASKKGLLKTDPNTGYTELDPKALKKLLETKSVEELENIKRQAALIVRRGQIERGLYNKFLKYSTAKDVAGITSSLRRRPVRAAKAKANDALSHVVSQITDPAMYEARLLQRSRSNQADPLYEVFHGGLREPMRQHQQNGAQTRRYGATISKRHLGIDATTVDGQFKLGRYLNEDLGDGVTRNAAMWAYALSTDEGRAAALKTSKIEINGEVRDPEGAIGKLSARDRAFVDELKLWFDKNPVVEKAFSNFVLEHGYEPERVRGWFTSSRDAAQARLDPDFGTFTTSLMKDVDPLKRRSDKANQPFQVEDGFYTAFLDAADRISMYAEVAPALNRAERVFIDPNVRREWVARYGEADYKAHQLYLSNIAGQVGHTQTAIDRAVNKAISGFQVSRVAGNLFSAVKQGLHLFTLYGDGTIDASAISRAVKERAAFDSRVDKRMMAGSGMAYQRYTGGRFLENILVLGKENKLPSRRTLIEHKSMVLQRNVDRAVMRTAWRAAEVSAENLGLKGDAALRHTQQLFEIAAGRDQPTDNPLYASELEIFAKRQPLARGAVMFMREQNRIYNMMRRHVVTAVQDPSPTNVARATRALFFGLLANTVGVAGINAIRRATFGGQETEPKHLANDAIDSLFGSFYLLSPGSEVAKVLAGTQDTVFTDRMLGPVGSIVLDAGKALIGLKQGLTETGDVESGINRGDSKSSRGFYTAFDKGLSTASALSGLPFWGLWSMAKGLYSWTETDYRLMTAVEAERARLKADGEENSSRYKDLEESKKRINEIHRQRESGLLSKDQARDRIVNELERVVR